MILSSLGIPYYVCSSCNKVETLKSIKSNGDRCSECRHIVYVKHKYGEIIEPVMFNRREQMTKLYNKLFKMYFKEVRYENGKKV